LRELNPGGEHAYAGCVKAQFNFAFFK